MKRFCINLACVAIVVIVGIQMFILKYKVLAMEKELAFYHTQIEKDIKDIHILKAEWALLNDPERLKELIRTQTNWQEATPSQIVYITDLPNRDEMDKKEGKKN